MDPEYKRRRKAFDEVNEIPREAYDRMASFAKAAQAWRAATQGANVEMQTKIARARAEDEASRAGGCVVEGVVLSRSFSPMEE